MFKKFDQFVNESNHGHFLDDLKANFRSWEQDHDNQKDAEDLFKIMSERHPEEDSIKLKEWCYHWVGYEEPKEVQQKIQFHEAFQKHILGQKVKREYEHPDRFMGRGLEFENGYKYVSRGGGCSGEDCNDSHIIGPENDLIASESW